MGYGVIGSPTGSGPVSLGSSPGTPAAFERILSAFSRLMSYSPYDVPLSTEIYH
jgi:hypothetical protein